MSFKLAGNPDNANNEFGAPAVKTMTVEATGTAAQSYSFNASNTSHDAMGWTDKGYSFVAKSSSTTIIFKSTNDGYAGAAIDNVSVTETVAPGAGCKYSGWKAMVDKTGTSFRNQGDCVSYYATGEKNLAN